MVCLAVTGMRCINPIQHLVLQKLKFLEQGYMFSSKSASQHTAAMPVPPKRHLRRTMVFLRRKTQVGLLGAAQFFKKALGSAGIPKYSKP